MYKLVIKDDEGNKTVIAFYRQEVTVGRKAGNTIRLTEQNVSRVHAKFTKSNDIIFIEDQESYVGTFINGELLTERKRILNGDEVLVGDYTITLINELSDDDETVLIQDDDTQVGESGGDKKSKITPVPISEITGKKDKAKGVNNSYKGTSLKPPYCKIVFLDQALEGKTFEITKTSMIVGKGSNCDIVINNKNLSSEHAKFICDSNKLVKIKDLTPPNGVSINGDSYPISQLQEGDLVKLGNLTFRFCDSASTYIYSKDTITEKKDNKKLFIIIGVIVVLAIIGVIASQMGGKKSTKKKTKKEKVEVKDTKKVTKKNIIDTPKLMNLKESGKNLIKQKNWEKAEVVYDKILEIDPDNEMAKGNIKLIKKQLKYKEQYNQAINLLAEKKYELAIERLEKLPNDTKYYDKYKDKKEVYFDTIISDIDSKLLKHDYKDIESYFNAARMMKLKPNKIIELHQRYKKAKNKTTKKRVKNNTTVKKTRSKNRALAKELAKKAGPFGPGTTKQRLKYAQDAIKADYSYPLAYYRAGLWAKTLGRKKMAISYYRAFLKFPKTNANLRNRATKNIKDLK